MTNKERKINQIPNSRENSLKKGSIKLVSCEVSAEKYKIKTAIVAKENCQKSLLLPDNPSLL